MEVVPVGDLQKIHMDSEVALTETAQHDKRSSPLFWGDENRLLRDEARAMVKLALPVASTYLLQMLPGVITMILVGRVNYYVVDDNRMEVSSSNNRKIFMDAAALATMFVNFVAMYTGIGEFCCSRSL